MLFLVTGAAGFIGSQVCEMLLGMGHQVRAIDCFTDFYPRGMKEQNLDAPLQHSAFGFVENDILEADMDSLLDGVSRVIHTAAQPGVRTSWGDNFRIYTNNNILSTQRLLEALKGRDGVRMVYASSSSVYGDTTDLPMREQSACWPVSPYGVSKLAAEHMCSLYYKNFGLDTVSLRYFTVYGPRQRPDMAFHRFIRALLEGTEMRIFGDGEQARDFTFVGDVARVTIDAALAPGAAGGIFNIGGGHMAKVNQVIKMLEEITGRKAKVKYLEVAKGDVRVTSADTARAREVLGFNPDYSLAEGLAKEAAWVEKMLPVLKEA